jgi:curved DNA-binding protein CbpA
VPSRQNRRNYYRILHVQPDAPGPVLKSSYRALMLSLEMHPDRGGDHWNAALINEAYGVLSDPVKRAEYDTMLDLSQFRSGPSSNGTATSTHTDSTTAGGPAHDVVDLPGCLFCGSERTRADPLTAASVCATCSSPLTPAGAAQLEASGRRAARRVAREGTVRYSTDWPHSAPNTGRIVDLSPRGLQFESGAPIERFRIIKLEGPILDAVGRVATCRAVETSFAVGVEFYTVRFHLSRGTFISTSA